MTYQDCFTKKSRTSCPDNNAFSRLYFKTTHGNDSLCRDVSPTPECQAIYDWQDTTDVAEIAFAGAVLYISVCAFFNF